MAAATSGVEKPDFELRGTVLFLMKEASYDYQLKPEEFPWFFDRPLLTKYLDYLYANRFNTIFLWSGNLFPSIVAMPEYPDATDLKPAELARNQEQFRWFTDECAKRNISVLLHFYSIHLPKALAKSRKIPMHYSKPDEFAAKFMRYTLGRFLREFDSVGLYVCPGEVLNPKYTAEWIHDVIIPAAKASEKNPPIVVRYWGLDADGIQKALRAGVRQSLYRIEAQRGNGGQPRAGRPPCDIGRSGEEAHRQFARSRRSSSRSAGAARCSSRRWSASGKRPGSTARKLWTGELALAVRPRPTRTATDGFWPQGKKLLSFERDAIWLEALGRYLWKVDRPQQRKRRLLEGETCGKVRQREGRRIAA